MATDIKELAIAYWRMEKWLNNTNVERKMAANSALRTIKRYLEVNKIELLDLVGQHYDCGLAVDVVCNYVPEGTDDSQIIIAETIKPIIMQEGAVIQFGQVSIGTTIKQIAINKEISNSETDDKDNSQNDMTKEIIELSKMIKAQNNNRLKAVGLIAIALLITILSVESILLFRVNQSINSNIKTQGTIIEEENSGQPTNTPVSQQNIGVSTDDKSSKIEFIEYEIKPGDSLLSICNEMGISYDSSIAYIKNMNDISDINKIFIGDKILLPNNNKEGK